MLEVKELEEVKRSKWEFKSYGNAIVMKADTLSGKVEVVKHHLFTKPRVYINRVELDEESALELYNYLIERYEV